VQHLTIDVVRYPARKLGLDMQQMHFRARSESPDVVHQVRGGTHCTLGIIDCQ
jgi:hypothetical protein